MNSQIGLGIFGTFGEPYGFQQVFYYGAHCQGSLDLNDAAIEFYPGEDLYAVRRSIIDGVHTVCISIYTSVQERNTERMSTFLGSCMTLEDGFTEAEYIFKVLTSLHHDLLSNEHNVSNGVINVEQGADIIIREPAEFVAAQANLVPLNKTPFFSSFVDESRSYLILPSPHAFGDNNAEVMDFLDEAIKHYTDTGTLYFSFDRNVYDYVRNAGIIDVMEWADFKDRKAKMRKASAVRTKKGIRKGTVVDLSIGDDAHVTPALVASDIAEEQEDEVEESHINTADKTITGSVYSHNVNDESRPFDIWDEPDGYWTEEEARERVHEYNRLFRYTNSLLDHINRPQPRNKRRRLAAAVLLLFLIGACVAVYFLSLQNTIPPPAQVSVESPRSIHQSNISTNGDSMAAAAEIAAADSEAADAVGPVAAAPSAISSMGTGEPDEEEEYEEEYEDEKEYEEPAGRTATAAPAAHAPATTAVGGSTVSGDSLSSMPGINMPSAPRSNMPPGSEYVSRVGKNTTPAKPAVSNTRTAPHTPAVTTPAAATTPRTPATVGTTAQQPVVSGNTAGSVAGTAPASVTAGTTSAPAAANSIATSPATGVQPARTVVATTPAAAITTVAKPAAPSVTPSVAATLPIAGKNTPAPVNTHSPVPTVPSANGSTVRTASVTPAPPAPATAASVTAVITGKAVPPGTASLNGSSTPAGTDSGGKPLTVTPASSLLALTAAGSSVNPLTTPSAGKTTAVRGGAKSEIPGYENVRNVEAPAARRSTMPTRGLHPRPNGQITQRDIPILARTGIKGKTLTELTKIILEGAPESVGVYYAGQELQYAAALLNSNRQAFERRGSDYVCTADYLILHIPAIIRPGRPVAFPK